MQRYEILYMLPNIGDQNKNLTVQTLLFVLQGECESSIQMAVHLINESSIQMAVVVRTS